MNCTACRYELSQCLDGRLPSGRRTLVMEHAAACSECGAFWNELQAAQRLTLQLRGVRVSEGFRDELWERIRAGEGTPDAVFREPVPMLVKVRYALAGAAAAAVALVGASMWRVTADAPHQDAVAVHEPKTGPTSGHLQPMQPNAIIAGGSGGTAAPEMITIDQAPLFASTQRLTSRLVATEAAKQLEQRHADVTLALRRLDDRNDERVVRDLFVSVGQFRAFGELLLDLRDRGRIGFKEENANVDLKFAVTMFGPDLAERSLDTAREIVGKAMGSRHLASLSRNLWIEPDTEDTDLLAGLITQRPEVFREMFVVVGNDADPTHQLGGMLRGEAFFMPDECGPSWVAPRSELQAREGRLQMRQHRASGTQQIEIRIQRQR